MCVLFRARIQNKFNGMVIAVFVELDTLFSKYEAVSGIPRKIIPVAQVRYIQKVIDSLKSKSK